MADEGKLEETGDDWERK
jgi:hypothetical protein